MPEATQVRSMFARIAGSYDFLNHALSAGIDRRWRRRVVERAGETAGEVVIDACCGTGDLGLEFARSGATVVGVDFTPEMLQCALPKQGRVESPTLFTNGDALLLPIGSASADIACVGFGIRNVASRATALEEMKRVLRPGGRVLVLEFSQPPGVVFGSLYRFYFTKVLPNLGKLWSRDDDAYAYLARTVMAWPSPGELQAEMEAVGLVDCGFELLTRGIACLHWGKLPEADQTR